MKITIHWAINGATVIVDRQEPETTPISEVYEFNDDNEDNCTGIQGMVRLLHDLAEHLGVVGHKRSRERLKITVEHGYDYECSDKDCKICKKELP